MVFPQIFEYALLQYAKNMNESPRRDCWQMYIRRDVAYATDEVKVLLEPTIHDLSPYMAADSLAV